ncbi:hypothetical protein K402DRAFT_410136 [Aulographum hederae CBS 113979]|uniref:Uncharacterized protein n=1 Tax=Aulographum hederae CBS 113979 TaxID=1176131 RepID=A0A6G1HC73_9PEZI|nr:hypothetical protein K402DRAFT_410136 [Aulographum hederae CBS 113979]
MSLPTVAAKLAYDCISAVALNVSAANDLVDSLKPFVDWQSTIKVLADPPAEYVKKVQPAVDIFGGLDKIKADVGSGAIESEYGFGVRLYDLIQSAHDGHFVYVPDTIGSVFNWGRPLSLVSVSEDGVKLPAVFVFEDFLAAAGGPVATSVNTAISQGIGQIQAAGLEWSPSPITEINGKPAAEYLMEWSQHDSLHDRDALYNDLFYSIPQAVQEGEGSAVGTFAGGGRGRWVYPDAETALTFANGSTRTYENFASIQISFDGLDSPEKLKGIFSSIPDAGLDLTGSPFGMNPTTGGPNSMPMPGTGGQQGAAGAPLKPAADPVPAAGGATGPPGYPPPTIRTSDSSVAGYYLDTAAGPVTQPDAAFSEVAVLSVQNFLAEDFKDTVMKFLNASTTNDKKTKLVIDLSANGGGNIILAYELFKHFAPDMDPFGGTRFRATEAFNTMGAYTSEMLKPGNTKTALFGGTIMQQYKELIFNYQNDIDSVGKKFVSWPSKDGPHTAQGDNFTSIIRWDLNDAALVASLGFSVAGYAGAPKPHKTFDPRDVVILTDGYCASTCATFVEFARQHLKMKTVAIGGRPIVGAMQTVGGVKGANVYGFSDIQNWITSLFMAGNEATKKDLMKTSLSKYNTMLPFLRSPYDISPSVNARDNIRQNDSLALPTQFMYEAADCRLLYTPQMIFDTTVTWRAVADAVWGSAGGKTKCVDGGFGMPGLLPSGPLMGGMMGATQGTRGVATKGARVPGLETGALGGFGKSLGLRTRPTKKGDGYMMP